MDSNPLSSGEHDAQAFAFASAANRRRLLHRSARCLMEAQPKDVDLRAWLISGGFEVDVQAILDLVKDFILRILGIR